MILLAHPYFLRDDAKQLERMKPYPPLATLLCAAVLREKGHAVTLFDAMLADGVDDFRASLAATRPSLVWISGTPSSPTTQTSRALAAR